MHGSASSRSTSGAPGTRLANPARPTRPLGPARLLYDRKLNRQSDSPGFCPTRGRVQQVPHIINWRQGRRVLDSQGFASAATPADQGPPGSLGGGKATSTVDVGRPPCAHSKAGTSRSSWGTKRQQCGSPEPFGQVLQPQERGGESSLQAAVRAEPGQGATTALHRRSRAVQTAQHQSACAYWAAGIWQGASGCCSMQDHMVSSNEGLPLLQLPKCSKHDVRRSCAWIVRWPGWTSASEGQSRCPSLS